MPTAMLLAAFLILAPTTLRAQRQAGNPADQFPWRNIGPATMMGRISSIDAVDRTFCVDVPDQIDFQLVVTLLEVVDAAEFEDPRTGPVVATPHLLVDSRPVSPCAFSQELQPGRSVAPHTIPMRRNTLA